MPDDSLTNTDYRGGRRDKARGYRRFPLSAGIALVIEKYSDGVATPPLIRGRSGKHRRTCVMRNSFPRIRVSLLIRFHRDVRPDENKERRCGRCTAFRSVNRPRVTRNPDIGADLISIRTKRPAFEHSRRYLLPLSIFYCRRFEPPHISDVQPGLGVVSLSNGKNGMTDFFAGCRLSQKLHESCSSNSFTP